HRLPELHRAALHALLGAGDPDDARLAFHADAAGESGLARTHALRAARAASAVASHREAAAQLERAVQHSTGLPARERALLLDELAEELSLVERWDDVVAVREEAVRLWHALGDPLREGAALTRLSVVMWRLCRGPEG